MPKLEEKKAGPRARITKTENWEVKNPNPSNPNDPRAKWEKKPGRDWRTKPTGTAPPEGLEAVSAWMKDMQEWGNMMVEAVQGLHERVDILETRCR